MCLVFALVNLGVSNTVGSGPGSGADLGVGILSKFFIGRTFFKLLKFFLLHEEVSSVV